MITSSEIGQKRSPSDLRKFVDQLKQDAQADTSERHLGIQKKELYKQFLEELIPLSCFAMLKYDDSYEVQLVLGNQGYDAIVFDGTGKVVDHIKITTPHDGAAEAKDPRLVVGRGFGQTHVGDPGEDFDALFPHVLATCQKKAEKDYEDCLLVVAIEPLPPFESFDVQYEQQIEELVREMRQIKIKAKKVFLLVLPDRVFNVNS